VGNHATTLPLRWEARAGAPRRSEPGDQLVLQIASTSAFYEAYRGAALVDFKRIDVEVPQLR
jgi:hypothetical protein